MAWLVAEAEQQPVLAVWEDLHWADPSTLEWLGLVLDQTPTVPLCHLLTCRPEFPLPWAPRSYLTQLTLARLTRPQVEEMVRRVTGGKSLPAEVMQQIVAKTDGVPLFVEELTKTVLESGLLREHEDHYALTGPLPPLAIPATLQDALMARLDRLAEGKPVAQLGAVLGRTFAYELLQAVAPLDELALGRGLVQLVQAEVLYQRGVPPHATYTFKHALVQDTAYQSLLRSTRQQYHQRTAQVMVERFPDLAETQPELLAQHYTEAGLAEHAIPYWQRAGERAAGRSAHAEAIGHFHKALEVLTLLPDTSERAQQELTLQRALGASLLATRGFAAPEVEHAYSRARALCQRLGIAARSARRCSASGGFIMCGGTWRAPVSSPNTSSPWRRVNTTRRFSWKGTGHWEIPCSSWASLSRPCRPGEGYCPVPSPADRTDALLYGQDLGMGCRVFAGPRPAGAGLSGPGTAARPGGPHPGT